MASDPQWIGAGKGTSVGTATIEADDELFTISSHGLSNGQAVTVDTLTGGAVGVLVVDAVYFVRDATTDTFGLSLTPFGPLVEFGSDGGADVYLWAPQYSPRELRRSDAALLYPGVSDPFGARQGVRPHSQVPVSVSGTTWTVHDLTAVVYPGLTTQSGPYRVQHPEESDSLDPADGSNPRIDALDLQVQDDDEDASGFRRARVVYEPGTPASSPSAEPVTANALRLATILVPAGGTPGPSVQTLAQWTVASGGILPVRDSSELPSSPHEGLYADQADTEALLRWDGSTWGTVGNSQGYQFGGRVIHTSSGTFDKGDHPGLRALDITVIGGGGGSGGVAACSAGEAAEAGGGQGGGGAKKFLDDMSLLASSETVTVGGGGNGGSTGNNSGSVGGTSSFTVDGGTNIVAPGGSAGAGGAASSGDAVAAGGSTGSVPTGGDLNMVGGAGGNGVIRGGESNRANFGGHAALGMGPLELTFAPSSTGGSGNNYGGGAAGPRNNDGDSAQSGQSGASGLIIVDLYF